MKIEGNKLDGSPADGLPGAARQMPAQEAFLDWVFSRPIWRRYPTPHRTEAEPQATPPERSDGVQPQEFTPTPTPERTP